MNKSFQSYGVAASWVPKNRVSRQLQFSDRQPQISNKSIKDFQFEFSYCMCKK